MSAAQKLLITDRAPRGTAHIPLEREKQKGLVDTLPGRAFLEHTLNADPRREETRQKLLTELQLKARSAETRQPAKASREASWPATTQPA
ncbi:hypothetical protein SKAU_G00334080 [Synaphobranchus kaupii]|uniref:Uncharacterized protein n=1 Tax=Synaphobranchus kaupii TaxID=118154 RepID=A0A9Q1IIJ6_SYNKA|nr:hypothetical protein SKAU_G00334080 [Synaphobranchus kaupii]